MITVCNLLAALARLTLSLGAALVLMGWEPAHAESALSPAQQAAWDAMERDAESCVINVRGVYRAGVYDRAEAAALLWNTCEQSTAIRLRKIFTTAPDWQIEAAAHTTVGYSVRERLPEFADRYRVQAP